MQSRTASSASLDSLARTSVNTLPKKRFRGRDAVMLKHALYLSVASLALMGLSARDAAAGDSQPMQIAQASAGKAAAPSKAATSATPNTLPLTPQVISGTVTSPHGPEAGVWVIAETTELGTPKFVKIV